MEIRTATAFQKYQRRESRSSSQVHVTSAPYFSLSARPPCRTARAQGPARRVTETSSPANKRTAPEKFKAQQANRQTHLLPAQVESETERAAGPFRAQGAETKAKQYQRCGRARATMAACKYTSHRVHLHSNRIEH